MADAQAMGLLHRLEHRLTVPGRQGDEVDDLRLDALLGQQLGSSLGSLHADGVGNDGHVLAGADDLGLADGVGLLIRQLGHLAFFLVEDLVLEVQDGVVGLNGGLQHHLGIIGIGGGDHHNTGDVDEERLQRLGVLGCAAEGHTVGRTHDQRHLGLAAEHIAGLGHLVQDLIHAGA